MLFYKKIAAGLFFAASACAANATGEMVATCSPYGPYGSVIQGWGIIQVQPDNSCGFSNPRRYIWQNLNGVSYGATAGVCSLYNLPNWWPIKYISSSGTCNGGTQCIIEYRGT